jgi:putative acetyltransferase
MIGQEQAGDANQIRLVHQQAFGGQTEAAIVDALRGSAGAVSLIATVENRIVGHILFTPVQIDGIAPNAPAAGLAPLAVLPEHQRQGIGSALVRAGLEACRSRGCSLVVVLGHPEYYSRFGFVQASTVGLACEFPVPVEAFMALELAAGELHHARGIVRYRPEFSET